MKSIIFDFDGTIADSLPMVIEIGHELLGDFSLNKRDIEHLRNLPMKEIIKQSGLPLWKVPSLLIKGKSLMSRRLNKLQPCQGIESTVRHLHKEGYALYVVSSNSKANIYIFLEKHDIAHCFTQLYGNVGLFSKAQALKKVLKQHAIGVDDCMYVGDEVRDIEAAKKVGVAVAAVSWGYNAAGILKEYKPDFLIYSAEELVKVVGKYWQAKP